MYFFILLETQKGTQILTQNIATILYKFASK